MKADPYGPLKGKYAGAGATPHQDGTQGGTEQDNAVHGPDDWPQLDDAAYHGFADDIVKTIEPHSEADPVGLLLGVLVAFGALVGSGPHALADGSQHPARLNVVLVGNTARARKGTVLSHTKRLLRHADPKFMDKCVSGGLASGEGLIAAVRDGTENERDELKRLLVFEPEFARVLKVAEREGNTLSQVLRDSWDDGDLSNLTKHNPQQATGAHICVFANITEAELHRRLTNTEIGNGFANRFLFVCVRRSKMLPEGGNLEPAIIEKLGERLRKTACLARTRGQPLKRTDAARERWKEMYEGFPDHPDAVGELTARAEAQTLRLSVAYALLDGKDEIDLPHLEAAYAIWCYCEASVKRLFGDRTGDPDLDKLIAALRRAPDRKMARADVHGVFHRHRSKGVVDRLIGELVTRGTAKVIEVQTEGRTREEVHLQGSERSESSEERLSPPLLFSPNSLPSQAASPSEYRARE